MELAATEGLNDDGTEGFEEASPVGLLNEATLGAELPSHDGNVEGTPVGLMHGFTLGPELPNCRRHRSIN